MKFRFAIAFVVAGFSILTLACPSTTPILATERHEGFVYSELDRDSSPDASASEIAELVAGNTAFALDLYQWLIQDNDNLVFSPYSISMALTMAYAGACDFTASEMEGVLHYTLDEDTLHEAFNSLDLSLMSLGHDIGESDGRFELNIANAMWVNEKVTTKQDFLDILMTNYGLGVGTMDVSNPQECADKVNGWIMEMTEDLIEDVVDPGDIDGYTLAFLVNAIYFFSNWDVKFDEADTQDEPFQLLDGTSVTVPLMHKTDDLYYSQGDGWQACGIPYIVDSVKMIILLPDTENFEEFEESLDIAKLTEIIDSMHQIELNLALPRFELRTNVQLGRTLSEMGMPSAFSVGFDAFPDIFEPFEIGMGNTRIKKVIHDAFISVDESGTEAAAATVIQFTTDSAPMMVYFRADHPFIYLIHDESTNTILFMGRVLDPES
ncbi:serpin family protein [bacterium]|nr:serpin family protein [bacterium]